MRKIVEDRFSVDAKCELFSIKREALTDREVQILLKRLNRLKRMYCENLLGLSRSHKRFISYRVQTEMQKYPLIINIKNNKNE
jgi:hypothetical protein